MEESKDISTKINDRIVDCGRKYAQFFENDNLSFTQSMLVFSGCRELMRWVYGLLVARKQLKPLEELSQEEKEEMWNFIKEVCVDEHQTREKMHQMVIVFYTIEYFLNEKQKS